jgi:hypothetical protein
VNKLRAIDLFELFSHLASRCYRSVAINLSRRLREQIAQTEWSPGLCSQIATVCVRRVALARKGANAVARHSTIPR